MAGEDGGEKERKRNGMVESEKKEEKISNAKKETESE